MELKVGTNVTLKVAPGVYFPEQVGEALAYQVVNNKTGVVEFEEVQLAAAWEAFTHFDTVIGDIYDEIAGKTKPAIQLVSSDKSPVELAAEELDPDLPKPH